MSEELMPCPWQKEGELHVPIVMEAMGEAWVRCTCDVAGPMCATKEQAIERWNDRRERTCHDEELDDEHCFKCSLCEYEYSAVGGFGCDFGDDPDFTYCPDCGAKVVGA